VPKRELANETFKKDLLFLVGVFGDANGTRKNTNNSKAHHQTLPKRGLDVRIIKGRINQPSLISTTRWTLQEQQERPKTQMQ
jgi:hypothetical protein